MLSSTSAPPDPPAGSRSAPLVPAVPPAPPLFSLAWPLFVELLLGIGIGVIGTALAARMSDDKGAAFAVANYVSGSLFLLFRLIAVGVSVVITQSLGGGRRDRADAVARAALGASSWLGGFSAAVALLFARPLLRLLNAPEDTVLPLAVPLLMCLAPALLMDAWNASMASVMRAHMRTRDTLVVMIVMQFITLGLALPLMPVLGLPGFALALFVSRATALGLHLLLWRTRLGLRPSRADWWRLPREPLAAILHIGLPGAGEILSFRLAFLASVAAAGKLGGTALATQTYIVQATSGIVLFALANGFAVEIMVGHMIGSGQLRAAHRLVRRALAAGLAISFVVSISVTLSARWILGFFTKDPQIIALGSHVMWLTVLHEAGRTFNVVVINGLRAAGDARFPMVAGAGSMLLVMAGGSWLLGVHLGLGLFGIWIAYASDEWLRGLIMWRRWRTLGWVPAARRTHRRVRPLGHAQPSSQVLTRKVTNEAA